jgi:GTP-binding protein HflX
MAKKIPEPTLKPKERACLIGVEFYGDDGILSLEDSLNELALLADTAGLSVVGRVTQKLDRPHAKTYVGPGKVEEIKALCEEWQADIVLFDDELNPRHNRELEEIFGNQIRILDRTALILDIFAQHAATREGALQVELAQYEYRLPRLTRAWTHLARQAGGGAGRSGSVGGVGLRGPGETQLEVDRREINRRIAHLKAEIEKVRIHRQQYRDRRKKSNLPTLTLVGYTNAGKSTLINRLAEADVYVANQLFATLDPTTRRLELTGGHEVLITDTVGFIQKLPTTLVAAFRATLEEIAEADLLLHVVDITHTNAKSQAEAVFQTLTEIDADHIPVITVLNKVDLLENPKIALAIMRSYPNAVAVSALKGDGIAELKEFLAKRLYDEYQKIVVSLPPRNNNLIALFKNQGKVDKIEYNPDRVTIEGRLPGRLVARYAQYSSDNQEPDPR